MDIQTGEFKYSGGELMEKLKTCWPDAFARSLGERHLCSALDIIRWMVVTLLKDGSFFDKGTRLGPVPCALTDFPIPEFSDAQTRRQYEEKIAYVYSRLAKFGRNGNPLDLFDVLENKMMTEQFWFNRRYLLYKSTAYEDRGEGIQEIKLNAKDIAKEGLIRIKYPEDLPIAIEKILSPSGCEGTEYSKFHAPTPPLFIRVFWDNDLWAAFDRGSPFETLQQLTVKYNDIRVEDNAIVSSQSSASYRLICLARISPPNEEPVAVHLYNCDGSHFLPPYGNGKDQSWSCKEPGKYYLMYYKSDRPRYRSETRYLAERKAPEPEHTRKERQDMSEFLRREFTSEKPLKKIQATSRVKQHAIIHAPRVTSADKSVQHSAPSPQPTIARPVPTTRPAANPSPVSHLTPGPQFMMKPTSVLHPAPGSQSGSSVSGESRQIRPNPTLHDEHAPLKRGQQDKVFQQNMPSKLSLSTGPSRPARVVHFEDMDEDEDEGVKEEENEGWEYQEAHMPSEQGLQQPAGAPKRKRFARENSLGIIMLTRTFPGTGEVATGNQDPDHQLVTRGTMTIDIGRNKTCDQDLVLVLVLQVPTPGSIGMAIGRDKTRDRDLVLVLVLRALTPGGVGIETGKDETDLVLVLQGVARIAHTAIDNNTCRPGLSSYSLGT
ncbi:hypothetical protein F4815DRAFT_504945 [Daldinia loculata]|nr:hypothetical protein F4815DRAFT_504945 [Daldinia loculata]